MNGCANSAFTRSRRRCEASNDPRAAALQERIQRLKGVLTWTLRTEYHERLTQAHKHLRQLNDDVAVLKARYDAFVRTRQAAVHSYVGYDAADQPSAYSCPRGAQAGEYADRAAGSADRDRGQSTSSRHAASASRSIRPRHAMQSRIATIARPRRRPAEGSDASLSPGLLRCAYPGFRRLRREPGQAHARQSARGASRIRRRARCRSTEGIDKATQSYQRFLDETPEAP